MDYEKLLLKVKLSESEQKELAQKIKSTKDDINSILRKKRIKVKVVLGGSAAKSTMLKGDFDVDLFAQFDYSYKDKNISKILGESLSTVYNLQKVNGSRNYYQFKHERINYELVPVLNIKHHTKAINVTDASPLHVDWVKKKTNNQLIDQIILTKLFLKANSLYGAESYIRGFSGHVVDILVIYYNGFENLLKASQKWRPYQVIDPEKHYKGLNKSKVGPLILVDPVQPDRNAAAALNPANFNKFKQIAASYLANPSEKFFRKEKITKAKLLKKTGENKLFFFNIKPLKGKQDVVGAKIMKTHQYIQHQFEKSDFIILDCGWDWEKDAISWFIIDKKQLEKIKEHEGPPLTSKKHVMAFKEQHKETFQKGKKIYAKVKRQYTKPEVLIKELMKSNYVKERVKKITL